MIPGCSHNDTQSVPAALREAASLLAAGRRAEAAAAYRRVLALAPGNADALYGLGILAYHAGRHADAAALFGQTLVQQPENAGACNNRGLALAALGRLEAALQSYDRAIALQPTAADALSNRGNALRELGRPHEALASLDRAVAARADHAEAWSNRGCVLMALGRPAEALGSHDRALALRPELPQVHVNRGLALRELGRLGEALASYDRAIALQPDYAEAHLNRAMTLRALRRPQEALASLDRGSGVPAIRAEVETVRGGVLNDLWRPEEALAALDRAIALRPDIEQSHVDRGVALTLLDRPAEALASFERAAVLAPDHTDPWSNRAAALVRLGRQPEALALLDRALALRPGDAVAELNKALLLLQAGGYGEAWPLFEARHRTVAGQAAARGFGRPQWRGEPLAGRVLLLHPEQGFGDTIQFCRYAMLAAARATAEGGRVILEAPPPLRALLATLPGGMQLVSQGEALPAFDLHCPLMSLPLAFGTTLATVPAPARYLRADAARVARWAPALAGLPGPRVGLAWAGNPAIYTSRTRAVPLAALLPLLGSGAGFVGLQKDVRPGDRTALEQAPGLRCLGPHFADYADTAAVIAQLDLVISADTSVAHVAAAMGKPTWVMLPLPTDWRWLLDRDDSPWYPTVQLFRQAIAGDWNGVVGRMRAALASLPGGAAG